MTIRRLLPVPLSLPLALGLAATTAGCSADGLFGDFGGDGGETGDGADSEGDPTGSAEGDGDGDGDGDESGATTTGDEDSDSDGANCPLDCGEGTCVDIDGQLYCECPEGTAWDAQDCAPCQVVDAEGAELALPVVRFEGAFLVNGAAPPKSEYDDANLWLENQATGDRVELGNTHDGGFAVQVTPGIYDLVYAVETPGAIMAHNPRAVLGKVALFESLVRDINIPVAGVGGPILLDGAPPPASEYDDANVFFRAHGGGEELLAANTHDGGYATNLIPDTYEIVYRVETPGPITPRNDGAVIETLVIETSVEVLPIEITSAPLSGAFLINGVTAPASEYDDANLELESTDAGTVVLGNTHDQSYAMRVIPGSYVVVYRHETGANVPGNRRARFGQLDLGEAGGSFDVDIPMVDLYGELSLNGAAPPASEYDDGTLSLVGLDGDDEIPLGNTHDGSYAVKLLPGSYHVVYAQETGGGTVPRNKAARLGQPLEVTVDGMHDIDITAVQVSGVFTVDGAAPPESNYEDGRVYLRNLVTGDSALLGNTSEGSYSAVVVPGDYELTYTRETGGDEVPSNENAALGQLSVLSSMIHDLDIPVVDLSGQLTLAGEPAPMSPDDGGQLYLRAPGGDSVLLGNTFAASFAARLVTGTYGVYYRAEGSVTMPANENGRFACITVE